MNLHYKDIWHKTLSKNNMFPITFANYRSFKLNIQDIIVNWGS